MLEDKLPEAQSKISQAIDNDPTGIIWIYSISNRMNKYIYFCFYNAKFWVRFSKPIYQ